MTPQAGMASTSLQDRSTGELLAALTVGVVLLTAAGVVALVGKRRFTQALPPTPNRPSRTSSRTLQP